MAIHAMLMGCVSKVFVGHFAQVIREIQSALIMTTPAISMKMAQSFVKGSVIRSSLAVFVLEGSTVPSMLMLLRTQI